MRSWKRAPQLGTRISQFSRRYFFSTAVVAMVIMSSYYWSGFPYDNLCETDRGLDPSYIGNYTFTKNGADPLIINTTSIDPVNGIPVYRYCKQDFIRSEGNSFPFVPSRQPEGDEWMSDEQENITTVFGWTAVVVSGLVILKFLYGWVEMAQNFLRSSYKANGKDQGIHFSDVTSICAYSAGTQSALFVSFGGSQYRQDRSRTL